MATITLARPDAKPNWLTQEGAMCAFDGDKDAKFRSYVHKKRRGPTSYCGYAKRPLISPKGSRCYTAVILRRSKKSEAVGSKTVERVALFDSERCARETALLWRCQLEGIDTSGMTPGHTSRQEQQRLLAQLNGTRRLHPILGPQPILLVQDEKTPETPGKEETPTPEHQQASEPEHTMADAASRAPSGIAADATDIAEVPQLNSQKGHLARLLETVRRTVAHTLE